MTCSTLEQLKKNYTVKEVGNKCQIQNDPQDIEEPPESTAVSNIMRNNPFCSRKLKMNSECASQQERYYPAEVTC